MTRLIEQNIELADEAAIEIARAMTPAQKLKAMSRMHVFVREWISEAARQDHPEWPESCIRIEIMRRLGVLEAWRMIVAKVDRAEGKS